MNKKIIGVALGIAFLAGCYFQNKDELNIPEEDIKKISFLDLDENQEKLIYTLEDKSYVNNGKDKKVLNFKVLSKFKMKDKEYYMQGKTQIKHQLLQKNLKIKLLKTGLFLRLNLKIL